MKSSVPILLLRETRNHDCQVCQKAHESLIVLVELKPSVRRLHANLSYFHIIQTIYFIPTGQITTDNKKQLRAACPGENNLNMYYSLTVFPEDIACNPSHPRAHTSRYLEVLSSFIFFEVASPILDNEGYAGTRRGLVHIVVRDSWVAK